jgi:hypothetical protein
MGCITSCPRASNTPQWLLKQDTQDLINPQVDAAPASVATSTAAFPSRPRRMERRILAFRPDVGMSSFMPLGNAFPLNNLLANQDSDFGAVCRYKNFLDVIDRDWMADALSDDGEACKYTAHVSDTCVLLYRD